MTTTVYVSDERMSAGWIQVKVPASPGRDRMRVWLMQHLNVSVLHPVPLREVPEDLRPWGCRWTAMTGRTEHGHVLILTDDQRPPERGAATGPAVGSGEAMESPPVGMRA